MSPIQVLLLDFQDAGELGAELLRILSSHSDMDLRLHHERLTSPISNDSERSLNELIARVSPDIIFVLLLFPPSQARPLIQMLLRASARVPLIVVTESGEPEEMMAYLELGVTDFLTAPLTRLATIPRVWRLIAQRRHNQICHHQLKEQIGLKQIIGESETLLAVIRRIPLIARCDATTLISGETGTGKEMCARATHYLSARAGQAFIPVNCGAIPHDLIENELFGHERGAFTDAARAQSGLIREADGGTLFLDEIDSLPPQAQVKLLRFLQEKEYRPLGSTKAQQANVRIIAASNADFDDAVETGMLRQDLYYRLNVLRLHLPPLRERREDIPLLARHFLEKYSAAFDKPMIGFAPDALRLLALGYWRGNVRELEHVIERAVALAEPPIIQSADLNLPQTSAARLMTFREAKMKVVEQFESAYIKDLLRKYQGNISHAARAAHKDRRSFWGLIRKYSIKPQSFQ